MLREKELGARERRKRQKLWVLRVEDIRERKTVDGGAGCCCYGYTLPCSYRRQREGRAVGRKVWIVR